MCFLIMQISLVLFVPLGSTDLQSEATLRTNIVLLSYSYGKNSMLKMFAYKTYSFGVIL